MNVKLHRCVRTNFHNAPTRVNQFVRTHRRNYETIHISKKKNPLLKYKR